MVANTAEMSQKTQELSFHIQQAIQYARSIASQGNTRLECNAMSSIEFADVFKNMFLFREKTSKLSESQFHEIIECIHETGFGNCFELSLLMLNYFLHHYPNINAEMFSLLNNEDGNHNFIVFCQTENNFSQDPNAFGENAMIGDAWSNQYYPVSTIGQNLGNFISQSTQAEDELIPKSEIELYACNQKEKYPERNKTTPYRPGFDQFILKDAFSLKKLNPSVQANDRRLLLEVRNLLTMLIALVRQEGACEDEIAEFKEPIEACLAQGHKDLSADLGLLSVEHQRELFQHKFSLRDLLQEKSPSLVSSGDYHQSFWHEPSIPSLSNKEIISATLSQQDSFG